jgi:hypothetical protein
METQTDENISIPILSSRSIREVLEMIWFDLISGRDAHIPYHETESLKRLHK